MTDLQTLKVWEEYRYNLQKATQIAIEDEATKRNRIKKLESDNEAWYKYYFPNYASSEPALFHKKSSRKFIDNNQIYIVRPWARELAKSARTMFDVFYLMFARKEAKCIELISHTNEQATLLLKPWKINLESNQRIINDYGAQVPIVGWSDDNFKTRNGNLIVGFGAGQSPRGVRNEEVRPDTLIFDDIDTDEEIINTERIDKKWNWIEQAVIPSMSVSGKKRILFNGNIIGNDTCITRAIKVADFAKVVNIRDEQGKSTWIKNSEEHIDWLLSKISYASAQKEYFNNPITVGQVFKKITWGKIPMLKTFSALVLYGDPSYSNKTDKQNSNKCVVLLGKKDNKFYVINCRLDKAVNSDFVSWYNELKNEYNAQSVQYYNYVENNTLQDPFFSQVLKPEFEKQGLLIRGDERQKPDKFFRIEGNLEPINSSGNLIFNDAEKDNPHMKRLEEQFKVFSKATARKLDGTDAVEGGVWVLNNKILQKTEIQTFKLEKSKKNYY